MMTAQEALAIAARYQLSGQLAAAEQMYRYVLEMDPYHGEALHSLGMLAVQADRSQEGLQWFRRALAEEPGNPAYWNNLGVAYNKVADFCQAAVACKQALSLQPAFAEALNNLGIALYHQANLTGAVDCYEKAIALRPDYAEAHCNWGCALKDQGKREEAIQAFEKSVRLNPHNPEAANMTGIAFQEQGDHARALEYYRQALQVRPDYADAANNVATALKEQGLLDDAIRMYCEVLRLNPTHVFAYYNLSQFAAEGRYRFTPQQVQQMRAIIGGRTSNSNLERSVVCFGLAAILDAEGAYDEAFRYYQEGNELRRGCLRAANRLFDAQRHHDLISRIVTTFDQGYFRQVQGWGLDSEVPVFVLGMPRSGTTVVEQILASHPQVFGGGELGDLPRIVANLARVAGKSDIVTPLPIPTAGQAREIGGRLLQRFTELGRGALRVTDKTLENFMYLGMIATVFPRARIIHCRRDPLDVCVSCYFQNFQGMDFAWSLEDVAVYFRQYERLMAHWREVLPVPMFEVSYEELIADQEAVSRGLMAHCGLEWHERCLAFYKTQRPVQTASTIQVRKPLSSKPVGRWRRYRSHLEPLLKALGQCRLPQTLSLVTDEVQAPPSGFHFESSSAHDHVTTVEGASAVAKAPAGQE
jgi:Flp pilus assembly protein TadD